MAKRKRWIHPWILVGLCVVILMGALSGCEPLRKKFTRKKKDTKKDEIIPVLNPIDYPPPHDSVQEKYRYHLGLWKLWFREIIQTVQANESEKRIEYYLNKGLLELEALRDLLPEAKRQEIGALVTDYQKVIAYAQQPKQFRHIHVLEQDIRRVDRELRNQFGFEDVESLLAP